MARLKKSLIHLAISLVLAATITLIFCRGRCLNNLYDFGIGVGYGTILAFGLWEGNGILSDWLSKLFPWEKRTLLRLILGVSSSVVFSGIFVAVLYYLYFVEFLGNSKEWYFRDIGANIAIALLITAIISLFLHAREFLTAWRQEALRAERLQREQAQSRLQSLRDQLNPHFLFNSLNVLTTLVHKDPDQAEQFIQKLSDTYRYVLEKSNQETTTLEEELGFIKNYLQLLKHRFGDNLQVDWNPPEAKNLNLPPLSLQMLVENAVKHNVISSKRPLTISVSGAEDGFLEVKNNLQTKRNKAPSSGVGLENIKARFAYLTDKEPRIEQTEEHFAVYLPLLHITQA